MPIGSESIKRATGAINKKAVETEKKSSFQANCALVDIEVSKVKFEPVSADCSELKKSVQKFGVLHPVFVLPNGNNFVLVSGHSRMTVALALNLKTIPAVVLRMQGNGETAAKKDVYKKSVPSVPVGVLASEMAVSAEEDLHEQKFRVTQGIGSELPDYLL